MPTPRPRPTDGGAASNIKVVLLVAGLSCDVCVQPLMPHGHRIIQEARLAPKAGAKRVWGGKGGAGEPGLSWGDLIR